MKVPNVRKGFSGWKLTKRPQDILAEEMFRNQYQARSQVELGFLINQKLPGKRSQSQNENAISSKKLTRRKARTKKGKRSSQLKSLNNDEYNNEYQNGELN